MPNFPTQPRPPHCPGAAYLRAPGTSSTAADLALRIDDPTGQITLNDDAADAPVDQANAQAWLCLLQAERCPDCPLQALKLMQEET